MCQWRAWRHNLPFTSVTMIYDTCFDQSSLPHVLAGAQPRYDWEIWRVMRWLHSTQLALALPCSLTWIREDQWKNFLSAVPQCLYKIIRVNQWLFLLPMCDTALCGSQECQHNTHHTSHPAATVIPDTQVSSHHIEGNWYLVTTLILQRCMMLQLKISDKEKYARTYHTHSIKLFLSRTSECKWCKFY